MSIKVYDVFRRRCYKLDFKETKEIKFDGADQESRRNEVLEKAKCSKKFSVLYYRIKCSNNSFDTNVKDSSLKNKDLCDIAILDLEIIAKFQNKCNSKDLCKLFLEICQNFRSVCPDELYFTMIELCYQNKNVCDQINNYCYTIMGNVKTIENLRDDLASANCEDDYKDLCKECTKYLCNALALGIKLYESVDAKVVKNNEVKAISIGEGNSLNINDGLCKDLINGDRTRLKKFHSGGFGTAYEYQGVVYKVLKDTITDGNKKALIAELRVLNLKHKNIIEIYDMVFYGGHPIIIMEHGGQSVQNAYSKTAMPDDDLWSFIRSVSNAIDYLHRNSSVHCDLKAENIVKNNQGVFKLIDFGLSHEVRQSLKIQSKVGQTPYFAAPEIDRVNTPTVKIDMWSFGMTILQVKDLPHLATFFMFPNFEEIKLEESRIYNEFVKTAWSDDLKDVLKMCLTVDPNKRCNASELKELIEKVKAE